MRPGPQEARAIVAAAVVALEPVELPLDLALGGALARQLWARNPLPAFDVSAMDGYAVRGRGPWRLRGTTLAGDRPAPALTDGDAIAVTTGAALPPGCDGVLRSEDAVSASGEIVGQAPAGRDVRRVGEECAPWTAVLAAGTAVTPAVLALTAALGYDTLSVRRAPRVRLVVTGRELLTAGDPHDGRIRDALGPLLAPSLRAMGAVPSAPVRSGDDETALVAALAGAADGNETDLVITTGGTAAGQTDQVRAALAQLDARLVLDGLGVRPGRPTLLSLLPGRGPAARCVPVLSLPGNPLAALAGLTLVGSAVLAALLGRAPATNRAAVLAVEVAAHPTATRVVPVRRLRGAAAPIGGNGAASLRAAAVADGLALVPPGRGCAAGSVVEVLDIPGSAPGT